MPDKGIRRSQANDLDLSGHAAADQFASTDAPSKTDGHIGKWISGNIVDGVIPVSDLMTSTGAGGSSQGMTVGGYGSLYGQVPRGVVDGSNTRFTLDYNLLEWWTWLEIGDVVQLPGVQGDPSNEPFGVMAVPGGEYQVQLGKNYITVQHPPQPGERFYIWYVRADPAAVGISAILTTTTEFAQNVSPTGGNATQTLYGEGLPFFGHLPFQSDTASYTKRTSSYDITNPGDLVSPTTEVGRQNLKVYFFSDYGTRFTSWTPGDYFDIYDVYLTVTFADSSTTVYRPTTYGVDVNSNLAHMVEDPPNWSSAYAIDGDVNTAARYNHTAGGNNLTTATGFWVGGWTPVSSTPAPTPVPLPTGSPISVSGGTTDLTPTNSGSPVIVTGSTATTVTLPPVFGAPAAPILGETPGGTNAARTLYAQVAYVNASGETLASTEAHLAVDANNLLTLASPPAVTGATGYDVYVSTTSGAETKQNFNSIPIGTSWTEPTTGLIAGTTAPPASNTASPSASYTNTIVDSGTSSVTIPVPSSATLNGSTNPITVQPGQTATVYFDPATNNYTVTVTGVTGSTTTHTELLTDSNGPITLASGDFIYVTGVPD